MEVETRNCKIILVVEDDESIRQTLKLALEIAGYQVCLAVNGKDGLNVLSDLPRPCLILLDLMMPVMDGRGFMDALEKDMTLADIPVVVVTAFSEKTKLTKAMGVIKKPVDLTILYGVVEKYCGLAEV